MKAALAILLLSVTLTIAITLTPHTIITRRTGVPENSGWRVIGRALPAQKVKFTIALEQRNLYELERRFWANSNPESPSFAKHMTREEVTALVAPPVEVQNKVIKWIKEAASSMDPSHLIEIKNEQDAILVTSTAFFAENLFNTKMHVFVNERDQNAVVKHFGDLSVPTDLVPHISLVTGITELPVIAKPVAKEVKEVKRQTGNNQCNNPYTIKNLYNIPQDLYVTDNRSQLSIYAYPSLDSPDGFGIASLAYYQHALGHPNSPLTCILGNDAENYSPQDDDTEANLDVEMSTGIAPNVFACFYIMEGGNGWMYEFTREIFSIPNAPLIVSMSYAWNEDQQCSTPDIEIANCTALHIPDSQTYTNLTNVQFQKLGLIGHTMISASGDGGISGNHGTTNNCLTQGPLFPAASPYVLSVGATSIEPSSQDSFNWRADVAAPPICTNQTYGCVCSTSTNEQPALSTNSAGFDSGGGFSFWAPQPSYQQTAVQAYLKSGVTLPPSIYFNPNNRGYPDVAGIGANVCLLDPGSSCSLVGGTSAAAPLWAGIIAHLNNDRFVVNKTPLGFITPLIYTMFAKGPQQYFYNGFAAGNNNGGCPTTMGFNAKANLWTPITGCGSPKFDQIRIYVQSLS